jgi:2-C-methyl-D-erythritol 4-phosphate cytidylyltransferase
MRESNSQDNTFKVGVVLPAAGEGRRFGEAKQFRLLGKRPLLFHALRPFLEEAYVYEIVVVVPQERVKQTERELRSLTRAKAIHVVPGGPRRQDSVYQGVKVLSAKCNLVCIHDAARPFLTPAMIQQTVVACENFDGAVVAVPSRDTVKQVDRLTHQIKTTLPRETIWLAQTPQTFHRKPLEKALQQAGQSGLMVTDEAMLLEELGYSLTIVEGSSMNVKITTPEDWGLAQYYYQQQFSTTPDASEAQ